LGFPDWSRLAEAFGIKSVVLKSGDVKSPVFIEVWNSPAPCLIVVPVHPEQTYFPKITSQVTASGGMVSAPLHKMTPELP
jgi:acetolactate synthase-1/2/3 large subunit